ncbi:MAG: lipoyl synthase [Deltaproteobacteria bacterium]|nr:lipoyl synthase [Deltaproteobacteria bacterium]
MTETKTPGQKKPPWLKKRVSTGQGYHRVVRLLKECSLHTVCEEALCPNLGECFSNGTATFMILGDHCTRNCRFCAVNKGVPEPPDKEEPRKVADAVKELELRYTVITSVTRDDLPDGGSGHFADTIRAIKHQNPETKVEVLIPDFQGSAEDLKTVVAAAPHVLNHNLETVPRLYPQVRPQADYHQSLTLIRRAVEMNPGLASKSGLMLGLGETHEEVQKVLYDLLAAGCKLLTLGQYLAPSKDHHPVVEYVPPDIFLKWEKSAFEMGFQGVASGPFVRSSFHAGEMFEKMKNQGSRA